MTIGTPRLHQQNVELFAKLNQEMKSIQSQVGSGKADLKLSENLHEIAKLSAAEEKIVETNQFMENSKRAATELEFLDVALDRLQNLTVNLQEIAVESGNDVLSTKERERFVNDVERLKKEILDIANMNDSFGNSLFGGVSGEEKPFSIDSKGNRFVYWLCSGSRGKSFSKFARSGKTLQVIHFLRIFLQEMERFQYLRSSTTLLKA